MIYGGICQKKATIRAEKANGFYGQSPLTTDFYEGSCVAYIMRTRLLGCAVTQEMPNQTYYSENTFLFTQPYFSKIGGLEMTESVMLMNLLTAVPDGCKNVE